MSTPPAAPPRASIPAFLVAGVLSLIVGAAIGNVVGTLLQFQDPVYVPTWRYFDESAGAWAPGTPSGPWIERSTGTTLADGRSIGTDDGLAYHLQAADGSRTPLTYAGDGQARSVIAANVAPDGTIGVVTCSDATYECTVALLRAGTTVLTPTPAMPGDAALVDVITPLADRGWLAETSGNGNAYWLRDGTWRDEPPLDLAEERSVASDGTVWRSVVLSRFGWELYVVMALVGLPIALGLTWLLTRGERPWRRIAIGWALVILVTIAGWALMIMLFLASGGPHGRPVRRRGRAVRPRPLRVRVGEGAPRSLRALARGLAWARDAAEEHAAIEAFEDLAADLEQLGAPRALVDRARQAAQEEVGHRDACIAVASRLTGLRFEAPREERAGERRVVSAASLAYESLVDGCIGEGRAAERAWADAARAPEPERDVLRRIAREEAGHAALAADVIAFARTLDAAGVERVLARA